MKTKLATQSTGHARLERTHARTNRLKHKNIVQLFDIYEDEDRVYLVMEL